MLRNAQEPLLGSANFLMPVTSMEVSKEGKY